CKHLRDIADQPYVLEHARFYKPRDIDKLAHSEDIPDVVIDSIWDFIFKCAYIGNRDAKDLKSTRA
ncbi:OLC1v1000954C1, partial [Oldenlandia corymbosa var. corymbosa]